MKQIKEFFLSKTGTYLLLASISLLLLGRAVYVTTDGYFYKQAKENLAEGRLAGGLSYLMRISSQRNYIDECENEIREMLQKRVDVTGVTNSSDMAELYVKSGAYSSALFLWGFEYKMTENGYYCFDVDDAAALTPKDKGYIGIMYWYGISPLEKDKYTARKYLVEAPDEMPFLVHKGDMTLANGYSQSLTGRRLLDMDKLEQANLYYKKAASLTPDDKSVTNRYKVTGAAVKSYNDAPSKWSHRYGNYYGHWEVKRMKHTQPSVWGGTYSYWLNNEVRHGWGCYCDDYNDSVILSKYSYDNPNGLSLKVSEEGTVFIGIYKNDHFVSGDYITESGEKRSGQFKYKNGKYTLAGGGVKTDIFGNTLK